MKSKVLYLALLTVFINCNLKRNISSSEVSMNESLYYKSINVFIHTSLFRKQTVFSLYDSEINSQLKCVRVGKSYNKFLVNLEKDRYKRGKLPVCLEVNESLFFWYDDDHIATDDEIALLKKYNILFDDIPENLIYLDTPLDEKQKGLHIYYCKNNFNIYKKVKSNIAIGYYDPPKINCYK